MSSAAERIIFISSQYTIYVIPLFLIAGLIGNSLNLLVFTTSRIFRDKRCAYLLIIISITDTAQLVINLTLRILTDALGVDPTQRSAVWCRVRGFLAQTFALVSVSTISYMAFDQFTSTSYSLRLRSLNTNRFARRFLIIAFCLCLLHGIPVSLFSQIESSRGCNIYNAAYLFYFTYVYFIGLAGLIPVAFSSVFGLLALYNIRHIVRREVNLTRRRLDQQLTAMALLRVITLAVLLLPYLAYRVYFLHQNVKQDDRDKAAIIQLTGAVANSFVILNYAV